MNNKDFIIRPYEPGDEFRINDMFNEVFNQQRGMEHWYWKYRDNPYGSYKIALAFAPDGTLAAHYGGYPVKVFCNPDKGEAKEFIVYHLGDKMTRKRFRGVGFGRNALLSLTFRAFQREFLGDAFFGYGFGTHHSLRFGLLFLDYVDIEPVSYWRISLEGLKRGLKVSSLRRLFDIRRVRKVNHIDSKWVDFFLRVAPCYGFLIKRDAQYLNWRYIKRPDRKYHILSVSRRGELSGWSIFFRDGNRMIWGDALFMPDDTESVKVLLMHLISDTYCDGCDNIEGWFAKRPGWWERILRTIGFEDKDEPSNLHLTGPITNPMALSLIKESFYYTLGDSDLF